MVLDLAVKSVELRANGSGFRVYEFGFKVYGSGFRVSGLKGLG